jgi:hypothetical protein
MEETLSRGWNDLLARDSGFLHVRLIIQPLVAVFLAIRAGCMDAREGRSAFFWSLLRTPRNRLALLRQLWKDVGTVFIIAVVLDVVYQIIVLRWIYPLQTLIVATLLAIVPYLVVRGPTNRIVSTVRHSRPRNNTGNSRHGQKDNCDSG